KIKIRGEIARLSVGREVHHPKIRLSVRAHGFIGRSIKSDLLSVRTDGKSARAHVNRSKLCRLAPVYRDRIDIGLAQFVIRLVSMIGHKINLRAVLSPGHISLRVTA